MKFELGEVVVTKKINEMMQRDMKFADFIVGSYNRYAKCDWGELCEDDRKSNEEALKNQERLMGVYQMDNGEKIWIITEWDRSVTTILFPEEY